MNNTSLQQDEDGSVCLVRTKFSDLCESKGEIVAKKMLIATIATFTDSGFCTACSNLE